MTSFMLDELPGVTFTVRRGRTDTAPNVAPNWLTITGVNTDGVVVFQMGAAGP